MDLELQKWPTTWIEGLFRALSHAFRVVLGLSAQVYQGFGPRRAVSVHCRWPQLSDVEPFRSRPCCEEAKSKGVGCGLSLFTCLTSKTAGIVSNRLKIEVRHASARSSHPWKRPETKRKALDLVCQGPTDDAFDMQAAMYSIH